MKAKELIEILKHRPESEVCIRLGDGTFVIDRAIHMAYTVFIHVEKMPPVIGPSSS